MRRLVGTVAVMAVGIVLLAVGPAGAHEGHGLPCAWPNSPEICDEDAMSSLGDEAGHAVQHGVSVSVLRESPTPTTIDVEPVVVTVANGTHVAPVEVVTAVRVLVPDRWEDWHLRMNACESGFDPLARNGTHVGLGQHASRYLPDRIDRFAPGRTLDEYLAGDVHLQVTVNEGLRAEQGVAPWRASERCWR